MKYQLTAITLLLAMSLSLSKAEDSAELLPAKPVMIDKQHVLVGHRRYQMLQDGKPGGEMNVVGRYSEDGQYLIHDHSVSEVLGVEEDLFQVLNGEDFTPQRSRVSGRFNDRYVNIHWDHQHKLTDGVIEMFDLKHDSGDDDGYRHTVAQRELPEGTLTRVATIYLAQAMPLALNKVIEFNWFNSLTGNLAPIRLEVTGSESVTVPAGTFDTYRVLLEGGQIENILYISKNEPRKTVRYDVIGSDIQLHLVDP